MSLYANYLKERQELECIETADGFISYKISKPECFINDTYVRPERRKNNIARELCDMVTTVAKKAGCEYLTLSVCPSSNGAHVSMLAALSYDMKLYKADKDLVYFIKRIT